MTSPRSSPHPSIESEFTSSTTTGVVEDAREQEGCLVEGLEPSATPAGG